MRQRRKLISLLILPLCGAWVVRAQQIPPASQPPVQDTQPAKNKAHSSPAVLDRLTLRPENDPETNCKMLVSALGTVSSLSKTQITLAEKSSDSEIPMTYLLNDQTTATGAVEKGAWVRVCYREADQKRTAAVIEVLEPAPAVPEAAARKIKPDAFPHSSRDNTPPVEDAGQLPSSPPSGDQAPSRKRPPGPGGPETAGERGAGDEGDTCVGSAVARGLVTSVSATGLVLEENTTHGAEKSAYVRGPETKEKGPIRPGVRAVICYSESAGKRTALSISAQEPD